MTFLVQKVSEPKLNKDGTLMIRTVKIGNKLLGTIETPKLKPGERPEATYWASSDVVRVSAAGNFLSVSRTHLAGMRTYAVKSVGLRCADGTCYRAPFDELHAIFVSVKGTLFVDTPRLIWEVTMPPEEERVANTMAKMRIAGRGGKSSMTSAP